MIRLHKIKLNNINTFVSYIADYSILFNNRITFKYLCLRNLLSPCKLIIDLCCKFLETRPSCAARNDKIKHS